MKNLIKILFVLSFLLPVYAQGQAVMWQKWYDYNNYEDNGEDIIQTFDGGYILLSINYISSGNSSVMSKIDMYGNIQWQKLFNGNNIGGFSISCYAVIQASDSGYIISGRDRDSAIIIRTDKRGELSWVKKFTRPGFHTAVFRDHKQTIDGGIIACGRLYDPAVGFVVRTDSLGKILWDSLYNFSSIIHKIVESKDRNMYMLGFGTDFVTSKYTLSKSNNVGKILWIKNSNLPSTDLIDHPSGNIFVGGGFDSLILTKIDTSGMVVFQKGYHNAVGGCNCMCLSADGNILLAGTGTFNGIMAVSKIDPYGNLIFNKKILSINSPKYSFIPYAVNSTLDSGFIFTGFTNYPPNFFESNMYATKTDSLCNSSLIVNVESSHLLIPDKFSLYQNYPNPFNPVTKISYELRNPGIVTLKIYDINGIEISCIVNEFKSIGKYMIRFDAQKYDLPSGIYIYQLKVSDTTTSKKMLLIK